MNRRVWKELGAYARGSRKAYALGFTFLLGTNAVQLLIPWTLRSAIHAIERQVNLLVLLKFSAIIGGLAILQAIVRTWSRWHILGASREIVTRIRSRFFSHLMDMDGHFYDRHHTGDLMSRAVNDLRTLQGLYGPGVMNLLNTAIVYIGVVTLLFQLDVTLTFYTILLFPLLYFGVHRVGLRIYEDSKDVQEQLGRISDFAQQNLTGIAQVKIFAQEESEQRAFHELCDSYRAKNMRMASSRALMMSMVGVVAGLETLLVIFLGGRHVIDGRLSLGDFVAFNAYLALLVHPTIALGWVIGVFQRGFGSMERTMEIHHSTSSFAEGKHFASLPSQEVSMEVRNLSFEFGSVPVLHDVTLAIPFGSRLAIVGSVGSGKSTLLHMIVGTYPPPKGAILFDGIDSRDLSVHDVRKCIGFVPQESFLFSMSLRENISYGTPQASVDEIQEVIAIAGLEETARELPEGLDTLVGERGVTLSGGQRQRVAIARALLRKPSILIFDDALSSVDANTEVLILDRIRSSMREMTFLFVTHRFTTLRNFSRIVVMKGGRVEADGSHENLLTHCAEYQKLYRASAYRAHLGEAA